MGSSTVSPPRPGVCTVCLFWAERRLQDWVSKRVPLWPAGKNMQSAQEHPEVVEQYLQNELSRGRMLGLFTRSDPLPPLHIDRFGVIPKGHNTGKWRLITDLSFPTGTSANDGIDPVLCSLSYVSVDKIASMVLLLRVGSLMAKVDIESAPPYRTWM